FQFEECDFLTLTDLTLSSGRRQVESGGSGGADLLHGVLTFVDCQGVRVTGCVVICLALPGRETARACLTFLRRQTNEIGPGARTARRGPQAGRRVVASGDLRGGVEDRGDRVRPAPVPTPNPPPAPAAAPDPAGVTQPRDHLTRLLATPSEAVRAAAARAG